MSTRTSSFGRYIVVDWSANATPKRGRDSIWIGVCDHAGVAAEPVNPPTRAAAFDLLATMLVDDQRPTLIGFDFPFGYPAGTAASCGLAGSTPWAAMWSHLCQAIVDGPRNANNRWEVAAHLNDRLGGHQFWGAPPRRTGPHLRSSKPTEPPLPWWRQSERRLHECHLHPFSTWQLLGAGSVGSQALMGIPVVHRLRQLEGVRRRAAVWPFETGLAAPSAAVVFAEVWPSQLEAEVIDRVRHSVKDARQVTALAKHLAASGRDGRLADWFTPHLPQPTADAVVGEEGWVLGLQ